MSRPLKILLCHNFYQRAGGERVAVLALKSLLEDNGHRVIFYTEDNRDIEDYNLLEKIGFFPRTIFSRRTYRRIRQIVARENPDIAHVHNVFPLLSPSIYLALNQASVPSVQTIHNYRLMCINGFFLRDGQVCERCKGGDFFSGVRFKCYRNSYLLSGLYATTIGGHRRWGSFEKIDRFIALTRFVADKLVESGVVSASKISILGNFMATPLPDYGPPDLKQPYVVSIGRLSSEKGIYTLLNAVRDMGGLRLKLMGTGPLLSDVRQYVEDNQLQNVDILGFINGDEKYHILRNALCCVVPSEWYENFPFVVLESAAVGTPVVASRIGSLATLVSHEETGLLFTPGDSRDLRAKLAYAAHNPQIAIQMGKLARQWVETNHTDDAHYEELMKIYHKTTKNRSLSILPSATPTKVEVVGADTVN